MIAHYFNLHFPEDMIGSIFSCAHLPSVYIFVSEVSVKIFGPFLSPVVCFHIVGCSHPGRTTPSSPNPSAMSNCTSFSSVLTCVKDLCTLSDHHIRILWSFRWTWAWGGSGQPLGGEGGCG